MTPARLSRPMITAGSITGLQRSLGNVAFAGLLAPRRDQRGRSALGAGGCRANGVATRAKRPQAGLIFRPKSTLPAAEIVGMLKRNPNVPKFLKNSLAVRGIMRRGKQPTEPAGTSSEFLEPYLATLNSSDWQFTTATSTIVHEPFHRVRFANPDIGQRDGAGLGECSVGGERQPGPNLLRFGRRAPCLIRALLLSCCRESTPAGRIRPAQGRRRRGSAGTC